MAPNMPGPIVLPGDFAQGVEDGVTIAVGDTQITITDQLPPSMPFDSGALNYIIALTGAFSSRN